MKDNQIWENVHAQFPKSISRRFSHFSSRVPMPLCLSFSCVIEAFSSKYGRFRYKDFANEPRIST